MHAFITSTNFNRIPQMEALWHFDAEEPLRTVNDSELQVKLSGPTNQSVSDGGTPQRRK